MLTEYQDLKELKSHSFSPMNLLSNDEIFFYNILDKQSERSDILSVLNIY